MSIIQGDDSATESVESLRKTPNTKSVSFAPLESTRVDGSFDEDDARSDDHVIDISDIDGSDFCSRKPLNTLFTPPVIDAQDDPESEKCPCDDVKPTQSHEKPKHKTENKVTFCDMPREISSSMADTPTSPSVPATPTTPSITYSEVIIVTDPPPGIWPIKRSPSLESRDNPFQPDGDLSKETEDLLSRAVIIRDKFILNDQGEVVISKSDSLNLSANNSPVKQSEEPGNGVIEESLSPTIANESRSVPDRPKQNGKIEDPSVSPDVMKPEVRSDCGNDDKLKGKKKQQKCCIIM